MIAATVYLKENGMLWGEAYEASIIGNEYWVFYASDIGSPLLGPRALIVNSKTGKVNIAPRF